MIFGSCHFLFHQLIQRDKAYKIILDMDALTALTAALVRRSDVDRLDQIMHGVWRQLFQIRMFLYFLDKQFQVLILLFLCFNILPQFFHIRFQRLLLILVISAHHGKTLVAHLTGYMILRCML